MQYATTDTATQNMDVNIPADADGQTTGVVIFIHGGGWVAGNKDDFNGLGLDTLLCNANMAMVTINYRLGSTYKYPACLDDIGLAIDYITAHAAQWHINPDKLSLFGRSSGAHLALQYAYTRNAAGRIKLVTDLFGPADLTAPDIIAGLLNGDVEAILGPYATNQAAWHDASPLYHLDGAIPTIIMHGTADSIVYTSQSLVLEDSLLARGIPTTFIPWTGNGHGWNQQRWNDSKDIVLGMIVYYLNK